MKHMFKIKRKPLSEMITVASENRGLEIILNIINQSDINVRELVKEMIGQVGEKWVCNNCGKETRTKGSIELHAEIHIDGLLFNCDKCGKEFRTRNMLSIHRTRNQ